MYRLTVRSCCQGDITAPVAIDTTATVINAAAATVHFEIGIVDLLLRVRVVADVCLEPPDVRLMALGRELRIGGDGRIGTAVPDSDLLVLVSAFDCTRLPIERSVQLRLTWRNASQLVDSVVLAYIPVESATGSKGPKNRFQATLPRHWLRTAGDVPLRLASVGDANATTAVDFVLTLSGSKPLVMVREVVGRPVGVLNPQRISGPASRPIRNSAGLRQAASFYQNGVTWNQLVRAQLSSVLSDSAGPIHRPAEWAPPD